MRMIADPCSLEMRTSATPKMTVKRIDRDGIDVRQNTAFLLNEAAEMDGSADVSNGAGRCVLGAEKYFSNMGSPC